MIALISVFLAAVFGVALFVIGVTLLIAYPILFLIPIGIAIVYGSLRIVGGGMVLLYDVVTKRREFNNDAIFLIVGLVGAGLVTLLLVTLGAHA